MILDQADGPLPRALCLRLFRVGAEDCDPDFHEFDVEFAVAVRVGVERVQDVPTSARAATVIVAISGALNRISGLFPSLKDGHHITNLPSRSVTPATIAGDVGSVGNGSV
jgi:hypothetical protein